MLGVQVKSLLRGVDARRFSVKRGTRQMERAKVLRAIRKKVRVRRGSRAEITNLPFDAGSEVEVIVVGPESKKGLGPAESIYDYTESLTRKKRIPRYSMKQIEQVIHSSRSASFSPNSPDGMR